MDTFKLGWFSTGRDQAARDLLQVVLKDIEKGNIPHSEISFVFCSREEGESVESDRFIQQVRENHIPLICFSSQRFKPELRKKGLELEQQGDISKIWEWRRLYDGEVTELIRNFPANLVVLAGYMLVVGEEMCREYPMVNLHPARPGGPKGSWQEVVWELMLKRSEETGVMMHLVTPVLDEGPPVTYCLFDIKGPNFDSGWRELEKREQQCPGLLRGGGVKAAKDFALFHEIRKQGLIREFPLISYTVKVFAEGRVRVQGEKILDSQGMELSQGCNLTKMIDGTIKKA
ncbi:formyltransferase family protein [Candidatus Contubernalis alkaliaceticus]|uniref:formyltransferase family protein n=1 Tax=Candidatus Contubernalis alkaliaceticus TaxID=338645 RepID=UPI001F4C3581|nr:formyltransferase family protein [Candidatus Contubernalis alkalaceticus]UNC91510.1 formyl transferase [Candidatus Contubernalis alkalaceticus]